MTQSLLVRPSQLNGDADPSVKRPATERNASAKKAKDVFPLAKTDSPPYLVTPPMATKTEEKSADSKVIAARNKNLDLAIQQIAKDYGDGAIMRLGDDKIVDIAVIP